MATLLLWVAPAPADAGWKLGFDGSGHRPHAGKSWPFSVTATTKSGRPLRAKILFQYLFAGQVVATGSPYGKRSTKPYPFRGRYNGKLRWPKRSIGFNLTFRVVVTVKKRGKKRADYAVAVRP